MFPKCAIFAGVFEQNHTGANTPHRSSPQLVNSQSSQPCACVPACVQIHTQI
jgi:hypothetical protein